MTGIIVSVINGAMMMAVLQCVKQERMIHFIGWQMGHVPEYLWAPPWLLVSLMTAAVALAGPIGFVA